MPQTFDTTFKNPLEMSASDVSKMTTRSFSEMVRRTAFQDLKTLSPISDRLENRDIRTVSLWFISFILRWASACGPSAPRAIVAALLRKAAETLDRSDNCN